MALAISQKTVNRMSLKQALLSVMEDRLDQEYKRKCATLQTSYNEWIRDKEKAQVEEARKQKAGRKQKEEKEPLHVFYDELETEGLFREQLARLLARARRKQAPFLIFARRGGEEGKSAVFLIRDFFDNHPEISLLYGDEDEISGEGKYRNPYFKPDWSPDTYLSCFYPGSLFAVRTGALLKLVASKEGEEFSPWQEEVPKISPQEKRRSAIFISRSDIYRRFFFTGTREKISIWEEIRSRSCCRVHTEGKNPLIRSVSSFLPRTIRSC